MATVPSHTCDESERADALTGRSTIEPLSQRETDDGVLQGVAVRAEPLFLQGVAILARRATSDEPARGGGARPGERWVAWRGLDLVSSGFEHQGSWGGACGPRHPEVAGSRSGSGLLG